MWATGAEILASPNITTVSTVSEDETHDAHDAHTFHEVHDVHDVYEAHKSHHEAICFISDDELSGRKILSVLGYLGFVKLRMKRGPAHAEGHERPDGFVLYKGSVVRESCYSALDFPEAYAKVTWEDNGFGVLEEDFCFRSPSDAARFVSGYKSINGPGNWTDENGNTLSSLRKNCFMTKREHPACKAVRLVRRVGRVKENN